MSKVVQLSPTVTWEGTTARGSGTVLGESGALGPLVVDLPSRIGETSGRTTPEELLAAARAVCFVTALGSVLAARRTPPVRLEVRATVTLDLSGERSEIPLIELVASGDVPSADGATFAEALREAEERCLISRVLTRGTTVRASGSLN